MTKGKQIGVPGKDYIGLGVGAVILKGKDHILLLKRSSTIPKVRTTVGMWSIPGGEVEFGEKVTDALRREVREELGVEISIEKLIGYWDQILPQSKIHWHSVTYLCRIVKGIPKIQEPGKFDRLDWFHVKKLPKNAGIAHVAAPLRMLGKMSKREFEKRLKETPES